MRVHHLEYRGIGGRAEDQVRGWKVYANEIAFLVYILKGTLNSMVCIVLFMYSC